MKILVVLSKYDYGVKERGYSYEYYNIYLPLLELYGEDNVLLFDFLTIYNESSKVGMNGNLKSLVVKEKPEVSLFCPYRNEFDENAIKSLSDFTRTCVYFFDDPWRQEYVRHWIKYFDFFSTPDYYMYKTYLNDGIKHCIYSPFGFNSSIYRKLDLQLKYDVSFVGGYSPLRAYVVKELRKNGIKVELFGRHWKKQGQYVSQEQMVEVFNQSRINLNLSNATNYDLFFLLWAAKSPRHLKNLMKLNKTKEQVKGRHFEINGCGGFQLSYFVPGLNKVYNIDEEIAVYEGESKLASIIKFFLKNDDFRHKIADAGYKKSQEKHTSDQYLNKLVTYIK